MPLLQNPYIAGTKYACFCPKEYNLGKYNLLNHKEEYSSEYMSVTFIFKCVFSGSKKEGSAENHREMKAAVSSKTYLCKLQFDGNILELLKACHLKDINKVINFCKAAIWVEIKHPVCNISCQ